MVDFFINQTRNGFLINHAFKLESIINENVIGNLYCKEQSAKIKFYAEKLQREIKIS